MVDNRQPMTYNSKWAYMMKNLKLADEMSVRQASVHLKISKTAVNKAIKKGKIKAVDMDGMLYAVVADVKKYKTR